MDANALLQRVKMQVKSTIWIYRKKKWKVCLSRQIQNSAMNITHNHRASFFQNQAFMYALATYRFGG